MIHVKLLREGWRVDLSVTGHAGAVKNEEGHDLVCCAASAMTYALAQRMVHLEQLELLLIDDMKLDGGDAHIACTAEQNGRERMNEAMDTIMTGYRLMAMAYPNCIDLQEA